MDKLKQIDKSNALEWRKNVEHMFQEIADTYEKINTFISMGMDKGWRLKLLRRLKRHYDSSHPVLDIGCGPGSLSALSKTSEFSHKYNSLTENKVSRKNFTCRTSLLIIGISESGGESPLLPPTNFENQ